MPVVRRANHHGVNLRTPHQLAPVPIGRTAAIGSQAPLICIEVFDLLASLIHAPRINVTHCHHLNIGLLEKTGDVRVSRLASGADEAERNATARRHSGAGSDHGRWHHDRHRQHATGAKSHTAQKSSARDLTGRCMSRRRFMESRLSLWITHGKRELGLRGERPMPFGRGVHGADRKQTSPPSQALSPSLNSTLGPWQVSPNRKRNRHIPIDRPKRPV